MTWPCRDQGSSLGFGTQAQSLRTRMCQFWWSKSYTCISTEMSWSTLACFCLLLAGIFHSLAPVPCTQPAGQFKATFDLSDRHLGKPWKPFRCELKRFCPSEIPQTFHLKLKCFRFDSPLSWLLVTPEVWSVTKQKHHLKNICCFYHQLLWAIA